MVREKEVLSNQRRCISYFSRRMAWICCLLIMHLSMSSWRGQGRRGIGRNFDIFLKVADKIPIPRQKREAKYTEIPHPRK